MTASPLDIARSFIAQGWAPVPIPHREKRPTLFEWETLRIDADDAPQYFNGADQNIGVILGEASRGLVDVDLDCDEAVRAAPYILPKTRCFGRASRRASHWLYFSNLWRSETKASLPFKSGSSKTTGKQPTRCFSNAASAEAARARRPCFPARRTGRPARRSPGRTRTRSPASTAPNCYVGAGPSPAS